MRCLLNLTLKTNIQEEIVFIYEGTTEEYNVVRSQQPCLMYENYISH